MSKRRYVQKWIRRNRTNNKTKRVYNMILSVDKGFGLDKFAFRDDKGELRYGKLESVVADAPMDTEDLPVFEGKKYYIGEEALMMDPQSIKPMVDYKEMERFAPLSIWNIANSIGVKPESIDTLAIGLSLAQKDYAKNFVQRVSYFKVGNTLFDFRKKILLIPQGIGAKYAIDHFFYKEGDAPTYAVIDIGQLTIDVVTVIKGKVRKENAKGEAHEGIVKIINELKERITEKTKGREFLSIKEVQQALMDGSIYLYGEEMDLTGDIEELKREYTSYILASLKEKYKNIFRKFHKIYFVGGGVYYLDKQSMDSSGIPPKMIEVPEGAEYYNAIGNLIFAERKTKESES